MGKETLTLAANKKDKFAVFFLNNKTVFIMIGLIIVAQLITNGLFITEQNLSSVSRQIAVSTVLAIGFTTVLASGGIDLSVGHMLSLLGVIYATLTLQMPMIGAIAITILFALMFGFINGSLSERFKMAPFIVTLATGQIFKGAAYLLTNGQAVAGFGNDVKFLGQGLIGGVFPIAFLFVIVLAIVISVLMTRTKYGRYVIAAGGNAQAASVSGVPVALVRIITYIIVACCAAIGAIVLTGRVGVALPNAGDGMEMDAIAAVIIGGTPLLGGKAKVLGTVFGCIIIGIISNCLNLMGINPFWQWVVKGLIILLAMFIDSRTEVFFNKRRVRI
jgi:ribose transport system permease protein